MKLLISFCNQPPENLHNLIILNTEDNTIFPLLKVPTSFTGVATDDNYIYALSQNIDYGLYIFDKHTCELIINEHLTPSAEPHSLIVDHDNIYIVSTGTDQILHYKFDKNNLKITFHEVIWQVDGSTGTADTHHLNSIAKLDENILVSGFGPKENDRWSSARNGYIYNTTQKRKIISKIYHPHSLCISDNKYYYCESSSRSVYKNKRRIIHLQSGYTRGLAIVNDLLILGTSSGRKRSKSTGLVNNPADPGMLEGDCRVLIFKKKFWGRYQLIKEINLIDKYSEIYDILILQP